MFVTDTHPLIWYLNQDRRLNSKVNTLFRETIEERRNVIVIPVAVLWEISLNIRAGGSIKLTVPYSEFTRRINSVSTLIVEPITSEIVTRSHLLDFHDDPFDLLIVATALERELPLITNDSVIHKTRPCQIFWD